MTHIVDPHIEIVANDRMSRQEFDAALAHSKPVQALLEPRCLRGASTHPKTEAVAEEVS